MILVLALGAAPAPAELGAPQCYVRALDGFTPDRALVLPANSGWQTIARLEYLLDSPSDIVLSARLMYAEDTYANANVRYQFWVDNVAAGPTFKVRSPAHAEDSDVLKAFRPNRQGIVTIELRAQNQEVTSGRDVYYKEIWLSPLLVDESEITKNAVSFTSQNVSSTSWTTLLNMQVNLPGGPDDKPRRLYLGGYSKAVSGWDQVYELAIFQGSTELQRYRLKTPDSVSGESIAFIVPPVKGTQVFSLRARLVSGSSTIGLSNPWLFAVSMPKDWTLFEKNGLASDVTITSNNRAPELATTIGFTQVSTIANASLGTCPGPGPRCYSLGHGFAYFSTTSGTHQNEASFRGFAYERSTEPVTSTELAQNYGGFDLAYGPSHTQGEVNMHAFPAGGGAYIGWLPGQDYLLRFTGFKFKDHASCSANQSPPHPVIDKDFFLFQYLMVPSTPHWQQVTGGTPTCAAALLGYGCVSHHIPGNAWYSARLDPNMHYVCETDLSVATVSRRNCL